ncbi:MAG: HlyD family efflux transporter periplasmic adaptor subunit [Flavobacteriaceae bacterium]|nr:HlyD family efflux transporter periplasmic adaptor subunit [Flavobacteriaceae bacterium]
MKKFYLFFGVLALLFLVIRFLPMKLNYTVRSTGKMFAQREWTLGRSAGGQLISTMRDNETDRIDNYGGREFQQGDMFDFHLDEKVLAKKFVTKGEILGRFYSNELDLQLEMLRNNLSVEQAGYEVSSTGEKAAIVDEAIKSRDLAKEKYAEQKNMFARAKRMHLDSLLTKQDYEIAQNNLETSRLSLELAEAHVMRYTTGQKEQALNFIRTKIKSIENQIDQLNKRLSSYSIKAPFSGIIQEKKGVIPGTVETILTLLDTTSYLIISPVQFKELRFLGQANSAQLLLLNDDQTLNGEVIHIDNTIQVIGGKQCVYVTIRVKDRVKGMMPGLFANAYIECGEISLWDYFKRVFGTMFYR